MSGRRLVVFLALSGFAVCNTSPGAHGSDLLERGKYLVEIAAVCGACHTTRTPAGVPVKGMEQAGGRVFAERGFRAVAPNITPDRDTGIGNWSNAEIANAIRNGHRPDGSLIGPPMPVESYRGITDRDLEAILAYLRTVPPVSNRITERSSYPFRLEPHGPPVRSVPEPANDPVARGAYLAINIVHCMDCHSGQLSEGRRDPDRAGATGLVFEGPWGATAARNISSHPEAGIGRWTDEQILRAITQGVSADGRKLVPPMSARAPIWAQMKPQDLRDIIAYLRSLTPQEF